MEENKMIQAIKPPTRFEITGSNDEPYSKSKEFENELVEKLTIFFNDAISKHDFKKQPETNIEAPIELSTCLGGGYQFKIGRGGNERIQIRLMEVYRDAGWDGLFIWGNNLFCQLRPAHMQATGQYRIISNINKYKKLLGDK